MYYSVHELVKHPSVVGRMMIKSIKSKDCPFGHLDSPDVLPTQDLLFNPAHCSLISHLEPNFPSFY